LPSRTRLTCTVRLRNQPHHRQTRSVIGHGAGASATTARASCHRAQAVAAAARSVGVLNRRPWCAAAPSAPGGRLCGGVENKNHRSKEFNDASLPYAVFFAPGGAAFHEGNMDLDAMSELACTGQNRRSLCRSLVRRLGSAS
jgi:hypothetical protein